MPAWCRGFQKPVNGLFVIFCAVSLGRLQFFADALRARKLN